MRNASNAAIASIFFTVVGLASTGAPTAPEVDKAAIESIAAQQIKAEQAFVEETGEPVTSGYNACGILEILPVGETAAAMVRHYGLGPKVAAGVTLAAHEHLCPDAEPSRST